MWKNMNEDKKMAIIKTVSCVTAATLATGMIGVAYINTTPGLNIGRTIGMSAEAQADDAVRECVHLRLHLVLPQHSEE